LRGSWRSCPARATRVHGWPLFIEGADGSPVTIVAEIDDDGEER